MNRHVPFRGACREPCNDHFSSHCRDQSAERHRVHYLARERGLLCALLLAAAFGVRAGNSVAAEPVAAAQTAPTAQPRQPTSYSAASLYNVGNAYARAGKPGPAVLNYERAWLLTPNDPDIEANLHRVREAAGLTPESPSRFERIAAIAGPQILAWVGLVGLLISGGSLVAGRLYPGRRRLLAGAALAGIVLMGMTLCNAIALWPTLHAAVVIAPSAPVRVAPVANEEPSFVLPEAQLVAVTAEHDGFVLIQTKAGRTGWVPEANLALVVPKQ
jgi:hypothetical protein